jgi:hypothetical protein
VIAGRVLIHGFKNPIRGMSISSDFVAGFPWLPPGGGEWVFFSFRNNLPGFLLAPPIKKTYPRITRIITD